MREATDTTLRYLKLLASLPRHPDRIGARALQGKLERDNPEYSVSLRTIQRDLDRLSGIFPISCIEQGRAKYWFWTEKDALTQIPDMGAPTALALRMAEEYLQAVLPPPTLELLRPYFKHARAVLADTELGAWASKVGIIHRGPDLIPPEVRAEVHEAVYEALLGGRQIKVMYRRRGAATSSERLLHPAGLVTRAGIVYLVACVEGYSDLRHFALHRMTAAQVLAEKARPTSGFNLDRHVRADDAFAYPLSERPISLKLFANDAVVEHLSESRLSEDQSITPGPDGRTLIEATVADTRELRWWLRGFGDHVEVQSPAGLRLEFKEHSRSLHELYEHGDGSPSPATGRRTENAGHHPPLARGDRSSRD